MDKFLPTWESVRSHKIPQWYEDAKLGIFIHWGLYSVPAYAPESGELGTVPDNEWFRCNPYSEWYYNSVNIGSGPSYEHHIKTYGKDFAYENFKNMWLAEKWDPEEWADLFKASGAKYVVLTSKHHDGFCLFPSAYTDYNSYNYGPKRDIVGELAKAVRNRGMKFGCYYSGFIDWTYMYEPILNDWQCHNVGCPTYEYADYVYKQYKELIDKYNIDVLWNDIGWPFAGERLLPSLLSYYYNKCPEGVINDRFNGLCSDFWCREYQSGIGDKSQKWEMSRGMGVSFAYNAYERKELILTPQKLTSLLACTVGTNGNLLINVGPMADGTIPEIQRNALLKMGEWVNENKNAIYGVKPERADIITKNGAKIFFVTRNNHHFAIIDGLSSDGECLAELKGYVSINSNQKITIRETPDGLFISSIEKDPFPVVLEKGFAYSS